MKSSYGYICRKNSQKIANLGHSPTEVVHLAYIDGVYRSLDHRRVRVHNSRVVPTKPNFSPTTRFSTEDDAQSSLTSPIRRSVRFALLALNWLSKLLFGTHQ
jgi:hypothetical protein